MLHTLRARSYQFHKSALGPLHFSSVTYITYTRSHQLYCTQPSLSHQFFYSPSEHFNINSALNHQKWSYGLVYITWTESTQFCGVPYRPSHTTSHHLDYITPLPLQTTWTMMHKFCCASPETSTISSIYQFPPGHILSGHTKLGNEGTSLCLG